MSINLPLWAIALAVVVGLFVVIPIVDRGSK